jgi:membrane dipeptidase
VPARLHQSFCHVLLLFMFPVSEKALSFHKSSIVIDPSVQYLISRTDRSDRSGLAAVGLTIPMPGEDAARTIPHIQEFYDIIDREPAFCLALSPDDIRKAHEQGRMAHIMLSQDSSFVGTSTRNLLLWYQLGLRVMQPTYNEQNFAGSGCLELHDPGLSKFGQVLVRDAQSTGITIDLTHAGARTFMDVCSLAKAPVIVSHANPSAVVENPRNISDDQIRAVAATGGVICVTTWAPLIWNGKPGMPTLDDYFRCLEYTIELVGIDHVATSTDSMGTMGAYPEHEFTADDLPYDSVTGEFDRLAQPPDSNNRQPADFNGIEDYPLVTEGLIERGYADEDVRKILGLNLMRVFDETWKSVLVP